MRVTSCRYGGLLGWAGREAAAARGPLQLGQLLLERRDRPLQSQDIGMIGGEKLSRALASSLRFDSSELRSCSARLAWLPGSSDRAAISLRSRMTSGWLLAVASASHDEFLLEHGQPIGAPEHGLAGIAQDGPEPRRLGQLALEQGLALPRGAQLVLHVGQFPRQAFLGLQVQQAGIRQAVREAFLELRERACDAASCSSTRSTSASRKRAVRAAASIRRASFSASHSPRQLVDHVARRDRIEVAERDLEGVGDVREASRPRVRRGDVERPHALLSRNRLTSSSSERLARSSR
jgi:hypothetical protein